MKNFKFNWGWGIALVYLGFMAMILYFVFGSVEAGVDLVTENYYQKDLEYETHMDKMNNADALAKKLTIDYNATNQEITLQFPAELKDISGEILCFRPSDKSQDFTTKIELNDYFQQTISTKSMINGKWYVRVDWKGNDKPFFTEESFFIQNSEVVIGNTGDGKNETGS
jgi:hypothetical protein